MKSGNLNFLEPSGTLQACNGTAFSRVLTCRCGFRQVWLSVSRASCCVGLGLSRVISEQMFCTAVDAEIYIFFNCGGVCHSGNMFTCAKFCDDPCLFGESKKGEWGSKNFWETLFQMMERQNSLGN
jgi:hypothetical protein